MGTISVKWYRDTMYGLPDIGNEASTTGMLALLDAVLTDGFGLVTLDSISVSGNIATATRSAGLGVYLAEQVIEIAGVASPSALNGQWRVIDKPTGNTVRFTTSGISDGSASGTMTLKTPGLGWERVWSSGLKRVFRSQHADSPKSYYRFNNTDNWENNAYATLSVSVSAYTDMTDIDTGSNNWHPSSIYGAWPRNYDGSKRFLVIGDERTVYSVIYILSHNTGWQLNGFGDFVSFIPEDPDNEFTSLNQTLNLFNGAFMQSPLNSSPRTDGNWHYNSRKVRRNAIGAYGGSWRAMRTHNDISGRSGLPYPSVGGNQIVVTDALMREYLTTGGDPVRGRLRGLYHVLNTLPLASQAEPHLVEGVVGLEGRKTFLKQYYDADGSGTVDARCLFDITGPWE